MVEKGASSICNPYIYKYKFHIIKFQAPSSCIFFYIFSFFVNIFFFLSFFLIFFIFIYFFYLFFFIRGEGLC